MVRAILGVVVGYVVIFVFIMASFTVMYLVLGTQGAFQPDRFFPTMTWNIGAIALGLIAAIVGGIVCKAIARTHTPAVVLAVVVLVLGLLMAVPVMMDDTPDAVRSGELSNFEAMQQAKQPLWAALLNPLIGCVGVLVGASLIGRGDTKIETPPGVDDSA